MAKIIHSDLAPSGAVKYSFAGAEFEIGGKRKSFESDDPAVISEANLHPWLSVEAPKAKPEAPAEPEVEEDHLAVEAGKDQKKAVTTGDGEIAETLAADNTDKKDKN